MADSDYQLIDSGSGEKLEQFGKYRLIRPCSQAIWHRDKDKADAWREAHASFNRRNGLHWHGRHKLPENWVIQANSVKMKLATTNFGHIGIFRKPLRSGMPFNQKSDLPRVRTQGTKRALPLFKSLRLLRRCDPSSRTGRSELLPRRRLKRHGSMGERKCPNQSTGRTPHSLDC